MKQVIAVKSIQIMVYHPNCENQLQPRDSSAVLELCWFGFLKKNLAICRLF